MSMRLISLLNSNCADRYTKTFSTRVSLKYIYNKNVCVYFLRWFAGKHFTGYCMTMMNVQSMQSLGKTHQSKHTVYYVSTVVYTIHETDTFLHAGIHHLINDVNMLSKSNKIHCWIKRYVMFSKIWTIPFKLADWDIRI